MTRQTRQWNDKAFALQKCVGAAPTVSAPVFIYLRFLFLWLFFRVIGKYNGFWTLNLNVCWNRRGTMVSCFVSLWSFLSWWVLTNTSFYRKQLISSGLLSGQTTEKNVDCAMVVPEMCTVWTLLVIFRGLPWLHLEFTRREEVLNITFIMRHLTGHIYAGVIRRY